MMSAQKDTAANPFAGNRTSAESNWANLFEAGSRHMGATAKIETPEPFEFSEDPPAASCIKTAEEIFAKIAENKMYSWPSGTGSGNTHETAAATKSDAQTEPPAVPQPESGQASCRALRDEDVTEHTALLWKYIPVPADKPEPAPEYLNRTEVFPGSKVIGARVRGKKHKHEGTNCDDWYETACYDRITFAAVSDGAGSKRFSRIGARESCKAAVGYLVDSFEKLFADTPDLGSSLTLALTDPKCIEACKILADIVQQSVIKARQAVESAFYARKTDPAYEKLQFKDLSGTLLIAVVIPVSVTPRENLVISCQIGDGMIAIVNSEGMYANSVKLMGVPDSGDYSGETDFLTSLKMQSVEALQQRTKISRCAADTIMLMSDGVADDYFPNETEMCRLYFDLLVNGILDRPSESVSLAALTQEQMKLFKRLPDPLVYPWVNDQSVCIGLQYTNRILKATGLTLEEIWKDPAVLSLARLELEGIAQIEDPSEKLKVWLDNYVERGSFDDRTLVLITM